MKHLKKIMIIMGLFFAHLHGQNQGEQKLSQQDQAALKLIGAMQESVNLSNQLQSQPSTPQRAQQENLLQDQFSNFLDQYLTQFGQVYEKQGGLMHAYMNIHHIASRDNKEKAITPHAYNLFLQTLEQATKNSDWGSTINLKLSINKNGLLSQKNLNLYEIVEAIKQVPLPANYSMTSIMLGTAAVAAIAAGALFVASSTSQNQQAVTGDTLLFSNETTPLNTPPIDQNIGTNDARPVESGTTSTIESSNSHQLDKKRWFENGLQRYIDTVTANPDLDNQIAGDNYIAPDKFDEMIAHPVTEATMLPVDIKNRLEIAHQNLQNPDFKLGTSVGLSLEKINQLHEEEGHAYIPSDEGDQSLGHTLSNLGIARMYAPAYNGIRPVTDAIMLQGPGMSNTINYAQQAKKAFLATKNPQLLLPAPTKNPQLLLPAPTNAAAQASRSVTTVKPAQLQATTQLMKINPQQFTTAVRAPAHSNTTIIEPKPPLISHAGWLPIQAPQKGSAISAQNNLHAIPRSDKTLIQTTEISGHAALEAPRLAPNNPSAAALKWTGSAAYSA